MNDLVKMSIESRKNAIYGAYSITDQNLIEKIDELFARINEFGENCADNMDFETKFASSELNQEYIQLFTEIATKCPQVDRPMEEPRSVKSDAEYYRDEAISELEYEARNATEPIRRQMRQEAYDKTSDMPVIGDIMTVKQHVDFFSRFKKKKKNKKEEADEK